MNTAIVAGIKYQKPQVYLLQETGIGTSEYAARTAYDSFNKSENQCIRECDANTENLLGHEFNRINSIMHSDLLDSLAWVHHHHSVLEHANLTYLIKGTSRGVLQEHARHRIQSITVQSTRYTMSPIINAFVACLHTHSKNVFQLILTEMDFLAVKDKAQYLEINQIWDKLWAQLQELGEDEFTKLALSKSNYEFFIEHNQSLTIDEMYKTLNNGKAKRNVGDNFKWIVTDNWKVDMVVTFNLRSLKNYFELRDSGAAYFQIKWLAQAMKEATPEKYLRLIDKSYKTK